MKRRRLTWARVLVPTLALAATSLYGAAAGGAPCPTPVVGYECAGGILESERYFLCPGPWTEQYSACGAGTPASNNPLMSEGAATTAQNCAMDLRTGCTGSTSTAAYYSLGNTLSAPGCGSNWNLRSHLFGGIPNDQHGWVTTQMITRDFSKPGGPCTGSGTGGTYLWQDRTINCPSGHKAVYDGVRDVDCKACAVGYVWSNPTSTSCITKASCTGTIQADSCVVGIVAGKNNGKGCAEGDVSCGNPFDPGSGTKTQVEPIFQSSGLGLVLVYNSLPIGRYLQARPYPFGALWSHRFETRVLFHANSVSVVRPRGQIYSFSKPTSGTLYGADKDVRDRLENVVDGGGATVGYRYTIVDEQIVEDYGTGGELLTVSDRSGNVTTLTYSTILTPPATAPAAGLLIGVADPFGRTMAFTYNGASRVATATDPAGGVYTFQYDGPSSNGAAGNLTSVTFPDGATRTYHYNEAAHVPNAQPNALTGLTDELGARYATWKYDTAGRTTASIVGGIVNTTAAYGSNTVTVTDPAGVARTYGTALLHGVGNVVSIAGGACPGCGPAGQTFDANGQLATKTDWNGNVTKIDHTNARVHLETARTWAFGTSLARTATTTWHSTFDLPTLIGEPGRSTELVYDVKGNLTSLTRKDTATNATRTWGFSLDGRGRVVAMNGPRTDVADATTYAYYADAVTCAGASTTGCRGEPAAITDALGHLTQILEYDAFGNATKIQDPNGATLVMAYDARQRLLSRTVQGLTTSYTYDAAGQLSRITLPDGAFLDFAYDAAHRLVEIADNLGHRVAYTLDAFGNRTAEAVYDGANQLVRNQTRVYSNLGRLTKIVGATGQTTAFAYDGEGNVTTITDPLGRVATRQFDALHRIVKVTDPTLSESSFAYDALDQIAKVTDPRGVVTDYVRDALGNMLEVKSPDSGHAVATYDSAGNLLTYTDAKGQLTTRAYDALGRVTTVDYAGGKQVTYGYDTGQYGVLRLTSSTDATGSKAYAYDALGRLVQESLLVDTPGASTSLTLGYEYDAAGHLAKMTYPSGRVVTYAYDALGQIGKVETTASTVTTTLADAVKHRPFGPMESFVTRGGATLARSFDLDGRIASFAAAGKTWTVTYDAASQITSIADAANATDARTYAYDAAARLVQATTPAGTETFAYDAVGNRVSRDPGGGAETLTYAGTSNRLLQIAAPNPRTYTYDANGSPTSDGTRNFTYDARGRLAGATNGVSAAQYFVSASGARVAKTVTR